MPEQEFSLRKYVPEEKTRKIFARVFDKRTIEAVHTLAVKGYFDVVEFIISTGKEAHVFRAVDKAGNFRAVKIYKIETSDFKNMGIYLHGDIRFKGIKKDKRSIISAWTRKESRNLSLMNRADVRAPLPIAFRDNVLVMEFIGENGVNARTLKENPIEGVQNLYATMVEFLARLLYKAELVHSDLSEYNILNYNNKPVLIDCAQAVLTSHPRAEQFFERDLRNLGNYFRKQGFEKSVEDFKSDIKARKSSILEKKHI